MAVTYTPKMAMAKPSRRGEPIFGLFLFSMEGLGEPRFRLSVGAELAGWSPDGRVKEGLGVAARARTTTPTPSFLAGGETFS